MRSLAETKIGIIGLGYVGLPLAVEFGKHFDTVGLDINAQRIAELKDGLDRSLEVDAEELASVKRLSYTANPADLLSCNVYIVTVPTPIDEHKRPDLTPLEKASDTVGKLLSKGDIVIYESTVYPGATEEVCVPILEARSGLSFNRDFYCGYSPERINPGDKEHRVTTIKKVTSGSTSEVADFVDELYRKIITAGTHKASSIKVAEAAKVIENTQRDVNIALINELAILFNKLGLNTLEVLEAAGSKWNFLPFRPGLVGGHCIGVDPYYLTHKAQEIGHHPEIILAGRRINDGMGEYVASRLVKLMTRRRLQVCQSNILIMGLTFKENCPDIRNTRVTDIIKELESYNARVDVYDTWANPEEVKEEYGIDLVRELPAGKYDAVVIAVAHREFKAMGVQAIRALAKPDGVLFDVKYALPHDIVDDYL
ncbi:Vi polysaccharide biosynthesis UDP-N-acetylglucosamine C-6 dehydrogenase TviB [Methylocaldum sp. RMAD-M]|jgi:UDP-N-acetyl-D-galactosamine dehydrogenase|nr:Vi polysaccharide biosynthesis UDP-N-acetylglucosamine C-6 dehydrogenase TviB [Methylocaldum sp. RMAD-M]MDV3241321.1 Vi polysaccharide biosynthesis UDP-N-acetylglucosamine C-6 dehydrogenase TviB [Methylocaldum sp.]MVF20858.1 Vi polysaccharide biosynthesis UDP-N-acetylglucosamine C-6 dehydrogenase TviB [Methylocaldum sp. BRCS4]